jgi:hypothetical protein
MTTYHEEFLKKNYITDVSQISTNAPSDVDINKIKIFDKNVDRAWGSLGKASANYTITITITQAIDRLLILNHNWDSYTVKYNSGNDFSTPISISSSTATNHYFRFNSQVPTTLEIVITALQGSDTIARVGQIVATETIHEVSSASGGVSRVIPVTAQALVPLSDGSFDKTFIRDLYGFRINFQAITETERNNYKTVRDYNKRNSMWFIKKPDDGETFNGVCGPVHWTNPADFWNETNDLEVNGYNVNIELRPAGGIG